MMELSDVINWRRWNALVTTSGQPTEAQFEQIKTLGVTDVINLGPHGNKGALADEPGTVAGLGMNYTYIPVDFAAPTDADFEQFCEALAQRDGKSVHVHCIYNARVSAFFYRYAKEARGGDVQNAFEMMEGIWRPGGVWADFIGDAASRDQENRYAGHQY